MRRLAVLFALALPVRLAAQLLDGSDFRVNVATLENQDLSHVAVSGDRFAVTYTRISSGAIGYVRLFDRAGLPTTGELSYTGFGGSGTVAGVPGGFVVAFFENNGIFVKRFDTAGGVVGSQFRVNQYTTGFRGNPVVAAGADGRFVVAWSGEGPDDTSGILAARFDPDAVRLVDDFLVNTYTTGGQIRPSVAFSGGNDAEFLVAWNGAGSGDTDGIFARRYSAAGVPASTEFRVNDATTGSASYPAAAAHPTGPAFVVAWEKTENAETHVFAQRFGKLGLATGEFRVDTTAPAAHPAVVFEPGGSFVVAYDGVRGQRFLSNGAPASAEFLVSTYTTGGNLNPSVASFAAGNFVATWTNTLRDGSNRGIYGQRFGPRGDVNGDGVVTITDVFYLINNLFAGGAPPIGPADANSIGGVDVNDVFFLINYLFAGGAAPAA